MTHHILNVNPQKGTIGHKIYSFLSLNSTNDVAAELARSDALHGTMVIAKIQTQGRGRGKNVWYSDWGGLYISIVLKPALSREQILPLSLVIANSVAKAIAAVTKIEIKTKWVNDLMIEQPLRKLGGILLETEGVSEPPDFFIAGIGINVNQTQFPTDEPITSLRLITQRKISRWQLVIIISQELEKDYQLFVKSNFLPFREEYKRRCLLLNRFISIIVGDNQYKGEVIDIDEKGRLVLLTSDKQIEKFAFGHILLEKDVP